MAQSQAKALKRKDLHDAISGKCEISHSMLISKPGLHMDMVMEAKLNYFSLESDAYCQEITPLLVAILNKRLVLVTKYLIEEGADVNRGLYDGLRPLTIALVNQSFDIASLLIAAGADVNYMDREGRLPMCFAIQSNSPVSIVKQMISAGAEKDGPINVIDKARPIMKAIVDMNVPVVKFLLEQSVDLNYPVMEGEPTPLTVAVSMKNAEIAKLLIDHGADVEGQAAELSAPLMSAILESEHDVGCLRLLTEAGTDVNRVFQMHANPLILVLCSKEKLLTALQFAALYENASAVEVLLSHGANVNAATPLTKRTALHLVCLKNYKMAENTYRKIINTLITNGADLSRKDASNCSPIKCCFNSNNYVALAELIKAGVDVNESHGEEGSIVTYAIVNSYTKLVKVCLEYGGDSSFKFKGKSAYQMAFNKNDTIITKMFFKYHPVNEILETTKRYPAVYKNQLKFFEGIKQNDEEAVKLTLQNGAEARAYLKEMQHPIFFPVANQSLAILKLLLNQGAPPNVHNENKETPLHIACQKGFTDGCYELLRNGACYNSKSSEGQTPLAVAVSSSIKSPKIIELLTNIHRTFRLTRKGLLTFANIEMAPDEVFYSHMNCVNCNGNTLMQEAILSGSLEVAWSIMNQRLSREIKFEG